MDPSPANLEIVAKLARMYERIKLPSSRACVLWLVGQYAVWQRGGDGYTIASFAPDLLRKAALNFTREVCINCFLEGLPLNFKFQARY